MKVIRTDNFGRDLPEKEIACGLDKQTAEFECAKLNGPLTEASPYWYVVTEESYEPMTAERINGVPSDDGDEPDKYGNTEKDPFRYCSFPDCGCDGHRLCMAREGANLGACALNIEKRRT